MRRLVALVVILLAVFLIYSPHVLHPGPYMNPVEGKLHQEPLGKYPYPLHADGWNHIAQARFLTEHHKFKNVDPQRSFYIFSTTRNLSVEKEYPYFSIEKGYHSFLASLSYATGSPISSLAPFIPAIIFFIIGLFVYLFFEKILHSPRGGLFAVLLLAFLPSTTYLLGFWFIVPFSMTLFLLCFGFLLDFSFTYKGLIPVILLLLISWFVYPLATLLLLVYFLLEIFFKYKRAIKQWWRKPFAKLHLFLAMISILIIFIVFINRFIFSKDWATTSRIILFSQVVPTLVVVLGLGGLIFFYKEKKSIKFFFYFFIAYMTLLYVLYPKIGFTLFFPYQRLLLMESWFIVISASLLLSKGLDYLELFIKNKKLLSPKVLSSGKELLTVFMLFMIIVFFLPSYYEANPLVNSVQKIVNEDQLALINSLDGVKGPIFADKFFSQIIYPLKGFPVVDVAPANLPGSEMYHFKDLFGVSCKNTTRLVWDSFAQYIITKRPIDCDQLTELRFSNGYYLYSPKWAIWFN